jgi:glycolate oxidase
MQYLCSMPAALAIDKAISYFISILGEPYVITTSHNLEEYSHDHTEDLHYTPDAVLLPSNELEVSKILAYCNTHNIIIIPRGAGTGLSGGALAHLGGVVISLKRLNKIIDIDTQNFQVTVEAGVINEELQQAVQQHGLFYPPDPASKGSCFIGGNIAHASGGPRALKYGTTRDYVLNLQVVLPNGDIIWTGANTLKYSTGYNLTHLIIGSEGTLAIVTKAVLKLIPLPPKNMLLLASFTSAQQACTAVNAIFLAGCTPSVCEFVEPQGFALSSAFTGIPFDIPPQVQAYLLIEVDGFTDEQVMLDCEKIYTCLEALNYHELLLADSADKKEIFWKLRRTIGESTKHNNVYKEEDTVVPRAQLPELFTGVKKIAEQYQLRTVCYGHAGDGNLHVNILKDNHSDTFWQSTVKLAIAEIFTLCKQLKGTLSGEHGIGLVQKEFMPIVMEHTHFEIMKGIKQAFDPNNILNPGKIF